MGDRDAAERDLLALGPAALPWVETARRTATGETAFRLAGMQRWLERRAADEAVEPATVTFSADDMPPTAVLRELFDRTGSSIDVALTATDGPAAERRISMRFDRLTFWEAIGEVLDRSGLSLEFRPPPAPMAAGKTPLPALSIVPAMRGPMPPAAAAAAGPLRVSIASVERTGLSPTDAPGAKLRGARVTLRVAWEPRLHPVLMRLPARSLVAEGPGGEAVPPQQRAAVTEATIPPGGAWVDLPVLLAPSAVPVDRLTTLRGTIVVWLTGRDHTFSFTGLRGDRAADATSIGRPVRVAEAEVRLVEARVAGGRLLVRAAVAYDTPSEALASHHSWLAARGLEACTANGRRLDRIDQELTARTDRGGTVTAEFSLPSAQEVPQAAGREEVAIRWTLPIAIHEEPVDFMLRDVPFASSQPD